MNNQKKLELTLCGMLPYGLKIYIENLRPNKITLLNGVQSDKIIMHSLVKEGYFKVKINESKPLLHSLDKLTEPILDGGLIPIVELAKMVKKEYEWAVLRNNVCSCTFYSFTYRYNSFYLKDSSYRLVMGQLELFEKLKEWHFNIYDLPKKMYIEKSESNGTT